MNRWVFLYILSIVAIAFYHFLPIGIVGEVSAMWGVVPHTIQNTETWQMGPISSVGICELQTTRPLVFCHIADWNIPISLNVYTPSVLDWPNALVYQMFPSPTTIRLLQYTMCVLATMWIGFLLLPHLQKPSGYIYIALFTSDWVYLFYKKALGNTEIALQIAIVLLGVSLLTEGKNTHKFAIVGICIGMLAKITFVVCVIPFLLIHIYKLRTDRRNISHTIFWIYAYIAILLCASIPNICTSIWVAKHQQDILVYSHDFWDMQWQRVSMAIQGQVTSARENHDNIWLWLLDPLPFFHTAYGVAENLLNTKLAVYGKCLGYLGCAIAACKTPTNIRWTKIAPISAFLLLSSLLLALVAKDMHHLAMLTPILWFCVVSIVDTSTLQPKWKYTLCLVLLVANLDILWRSPTIINSVGTPTFAEHQQESLRDFLAKNHVRNLITMDYEIYGVLEVIAPDIQSTHLWPAISAERNNALPHIIQQASQGNHLLVLRSSQAMMYNLQPSLEKLQSIAGTTQIELVDSIPNQVWLYRVTANTH